MLHAVDYSYPMLSDIGVSRQYILQLSLFVSGVGFVPAPFFTPQEILPQ
jgi:hypothetical protein